MEEQKTVAPQTENEVEKDTQNHGTGTDEHAGADTSGGDVEKQEQSPYQQQLDELNKKLEKKDEIIEHKNRAIESEKNKRKELEQKLETAKPSDVESLEQKIKQLTESIESIKGSKLDEKISRLTDDPVKQEVIKKHYHNSIVRTGDEDVDIRRALAIADENIVYQYHENRAREEGNDLFLTALPKSDVRGRQAGITSNPIALEAAQMLKNWGQDAAAERLLKP